MPDSDRTIDASGFEIDEAAHTLRFVRQLAASRIDVFRAWTTPEELAVWWDAGGEKLTVCEIDLRPGGSFRFIAPSHMHMPFTGTYVEIDPPERLVFETMGAIGRVLLAEHENGTRMTVEIACSSAEHLEQYVKLGVANGTAKTCDNLARFLAHKQ